MDGAILVGGEVRQRETKFSAINPATNEALSQPFSAADAQDVADACALASAAFERFATLEPQKRAAFLEAVAENILAIGDVLIETAMAETGLPRGRLEGERGRTVGQLRMFAAEVRLCAWLDVTIDPALPERAPAPRADLRRMNVSRRARRGVWRFQFPARLFGRRRRYGVGVRGGLPGCREGPSGASWHWRIGGARHSKRRRGARFAERRVLVFAGYVA